MSDPDAQIFTLFSKFPAELQLKIWEIAMPGPRIIKIGLLWELGDFPLYQKSPKVPSLLHACHDSRAVAIKKIKPHFENASRMPIYCDFENDTIHFESISALRTISARSDLGEERQQIRYLAIGISVWTSATHGLQDFRAIRAVILTMRDCLHWRETDKLLSDLAFTYLSRQWRHVHFMKEERAMQGDGRDLPRGYIIKQSDLEALKNEDQYWK